MSRTLDTGKTALRIRKLQADRVDFVLENADLAWAFKWNPEMPY